MQYSRNYIQQVCRIFGIIIIAFALSKADPDWNPVITDNNGSVIVEGSGAKIGTESMENGDWVGIFAYNPATGTNDICAGKIIIGESQNTGPVWGDDPYVSGKNGFNSGELMVFKIWDRSSDRIYENVTVSYNAGIFYNATGNYAANSIYHVLSLVAIVGTQNVAPSVPAEPNPADLAVGISINTSLSWNASIDADGDPVVYDIYFGEGTIPALPEQIGLSLPNYTPPLPLTFGKLYLWQVKARDNRGGVSSGPIWRFTTEAPPNQPPYFPNNPTPVDGATGVGPAPTLSWSGDDPDGDPVSYDIYLGAVDPPTVAVSLNQTATSLALSELTAGSIYYWMVTARDNRGGVSSGPIWRFTTETRPNQPPSQLTLPIPVHQAIGVTINQTLSWNASTDPEGGTITYNLYLGMGALPTLPTVSGLAQPLYTPLTPLSYATEYLWRVVAIDDLGASSSSEIWSFTTENIPITPPSTPILIAPANGESELDPDVQFRWSMPSSRQSLPNQEQMLFQLQVSSTDDFAWGTLLVDYDNIEQNSLLIHSILDYSSQYYWRVRARNTQGSSDWTAGWNFSTRAPDAENHPPFEPFQPTPSDQQLNVSIVTDLAWEGGDPDGDPVHYQVLMGIESPPITTAMSQSLNQRFSPGALDYNKTYYWQVIAADDKGLQTVGPIWSFTTQNAPNLPPSIPSGPVPEDSAQGVDLATTLSWMPSTDPENDPVTYDLYFGASLFHMIPKAQDLPEASFADDLQLAVGTRYYWRVVSKDDHGNTANGSIWSFNTDTLVSRNRPPYPPSNPNPAHEAVLVDLNPQLKWSGGDPDGDQVYYDIFFDTVSPPINRRAAAQTAESFSIVNLEYNRIYYWRIISADSEFTVSGPIWKFQTLAEPEPIPLAPVLINPENEADSVSITPVFTWHHSDYVRMYHFQLAVDSTFREIVRSIGNQADTNLTLNQELVRSTRYYWRARATNNSGASPWSAIWSFLTIPEPLTLDPPELIAPANYSTEVTNNPIFQWNEVINAQKYVLQVATVSDFSNFVIELANLSATTCKLEGLAPNTRYWWRVRAKSGTIRGDWSAAWEFTTTMGFDRLFAYILQPSADTSIIAGESVNFQGKRYDTDKPVAYQWDFGNGQSSQEQEPGFIQYSQPGVYHVRFSFEIEGFSSDTARRIVYVRPEPFVRNLLFTVYPYHFTNDKVLFRWKTNAEAQGVVLMGIDKSDLSLRQSAPLEKLEQIIQVQHIKLHQLYYYQIFAFNREDTVFSAVDSFIIHEFAQDNTPPFLLEQEHYLDNDEVIFRFRLNEPAMLTLRYGSASDQLIYSYHVPEYHDEHYIHLRNLDADSVYYYQLEMIDLVNNLGYFPNPSSSRGLSKNSSTLNFSTLSVPDLTSPRFISGPEVILKDNHWCIHWTTSKPTSYQLNISRESEIVSKFSDAYTFRCDNYIIISGLGNSYQVDLNIWDVNQNEENKTIYFLTDYSSPEGAIITTPLNTQEINDVLSMDWKTDVPAATAIRWGYAAEELNLEMRINDLTKDHYIALPSVKRNTPVYYQVKSCLNMDQICDDWSAINVFEFPVAIELDNSDSIKPSVPIELINYPNPFTKRTEIRFVLERPGETKISIYNMMGEMVKHWNPIFCRSGEHSLEWNGMNDHSEWLGSGIYFCRIESSYHTAIRKMMYVR